MMLYFFWRVGEGFGPAFSPNSEIRLEINVTWTDLRTVYDFCMLHPHHLQKKQKTDVYTENSNTILHPWWQLQMNFHCSEFHIYLRFFFLCQKRQFGQRRPASVDIGDINKSVETNVEKRVGAKSR